MTEQKSEKQKIVSIIIVTFNAPRYVWTVLATLRKTKNVSFKVVVVDNHSGLITRLVLYFSFLLRRIDRLCFLDENTFFSGGNNIGLNLVGRECSHVILLNSDIEIIHSNWLAKLLSVHRRGITAFGCVEDPEFPRADGYCFLIDRTIFEQYKLDESNFPWWWAITKLQSQVLADGLSVKAIRNHNDYVVHFGGKSGTKHLLKEKRFFSRPDLGGWFKSGRVEVIDSLS